MKTKFLNLLTLLSAVVLMTSFINADEFGACNPDKLYATNDYLYKDSYFKDNEKVKDNPKYPGGKDSIQAYFERAVQFTGNETELVAKYHVTFLVNCKGEAGLFELKSKEFPGYEKIMNACKSMVKWTPASVKKQAVDCYYRLGFTNQVGKIKVDYRED